MCNEYRRTVELGKISDAFAQLRIPLRFPEGAPNLAALDSIRITDPTAIVRQARGQEEEGAELVQRRWSWPGPTGKPVYNFRSDEREFPSGRCLIIADGFYEFTAPADPKQKKKDRWLFTAANGEMLGIAGLVRSVPDIGEAFTMLTTEPGPDVRPYHGRQVALIPPADWQSWLDHAEPAANLISALPAGSLKVQPAPR